MAIEWRPSHFSNGYDAYDCARFLGQVCRYADIDYEDGHVLRGHFWRGFLNGHDQPDVPGAHVAPEGAMAAVVAVVAVWTAL